MGLEGLKKKDRENKASNVNDFIDGAGKGRTGDTTEHDPNAPAKRTFTVPLNDYEIELLQKASEQQDRSMRKVSRRLLVDKLKSELGLD